MFKTHMAEAIMMIAMRVISKVNQAMAPPGFASLRALPLTSRTARKKRLRLSCCVDYLGWAPKSLGICQFCVLYGPKASEYWNKQMSVVRTLAALRLLKDLVDADLGIADHLPRDFGAWVNNCTLTRAYDELYLTKEVLHEELDSDGSLIPSFGGRQLRVTLKWLIAWLTDDQSTSCTT